MREPFVHHHHLTTSGRLFPNFTPEPWLPTTPEDIFAMIREKARSGPLPFKDMAYYVTDAFSWVAGFAGQMTLAFLLRDPAEAALSHVRLDPGLARADPGHEAQHRLYHVLVAQGQAPLALITDQLHDGLETTLARHWAHVWLVIAAHALAWDDRARQVWQSVKEWRSEALPSGATRRPERSDAAVHQAKLGAHSWTAPPAPRRSTPK